MSFTSRGSAWRSIAPALLIVALSGCAGEASPTRDQVTIDTIGGVETVTNTILRQPALGWTVGPPRFEVGRVEGGGADVFGSIGGLVVDDDGRVFVGDGDALEIRVFSPAGEHLYTFGREGQGPGEFQNIDAMRLTPADELMVRDVRQTRVSVFGLDGDFRRQLRIERPYMQFQNRPTLWVDAAGRMYDWIHMGGGDVDSLGVVVYADSGPVLHRVVTATLSRNMIRLLRDGRPFASMPVPLTPFASGAVDRSGRMVAGTGRTYELEVRTADGTLVRRVRREVEPVPSPEWLADTVQARLETFADGLQGVEVEDYDLPTHLPAFTHILVDDLDHVWVGRDGDQSRLTTTFDIFDPTGRFLGRLELPPLRLMQLGADFVAGIAYDELGVERAVILPLQRS